MDIGRTVLAFQFVLNVQNGGVGRDRCPLSPLCTVQYYWTLPYDRTV